VFDKKRKRRGKEKVNKKKQISPHLFLISSHIYLVLLSENKENSRAASIL
jgi:hypothetical protein